MKRPKSDFLWALEIVKRAPRSRTIKKQFLENLYRNRFDVFVECKEKDEPLCYGKVRLPEELVNRLELQDRQYVIFFFLRLGMKGFRRGTKIIAKKSTEFTPEHDMVLLICQVRYIKNRWYLMIHPADKIRFDIKCREVGWGSILKVIKLSLIHI